jgi:hypothetical protein
LNKAGFFAIVKMLIQKEVSLTEPGCSFGVTRV